MTFLRSSVITVLFLLLTTVSSRAVQTEGPTEHECRYHIDAALKQFIAGQQRTSPAPQAYQEAEPTDDIDDDDDVLTSTSPSEEETVSDEAQAQDSDEADQPDETTKSDESELSTENDEATKSEADSQEDEDEPGREKREVDSKEDDEDETKEVQEEVSGEEAEAEHSAEERAEPEVSEETGEDSKETGEEEHADTEGASDEEAEGDVTEGPGVEEEDESKEELEQAGAAEESGEEQKEASEESTDENEVSEGDEESEERVEEESFQGEHDEEEGKSEREDEASSAKSDESEGLSAEEADIAEHETEEESGERETEGKSTESEAEEKSGEHDAEDDGKSAEHETEEESTEQEAEGASAEQEAEGESAEQEAEGESAEQKAEGESAEEEAEGESADEEAAAESAEPEAGAESAEQEAGAESAEPEAEGESAEQEAGEESAEPEAEGESAEHEVEGKSAEQESGESAEHKESTSGEDQGSEEDQEEDQTSETRTQRSAEEDQAASDEVSDQEVEDASKEDAATASAESAEAEVPAVATVQPSVSEQPSSPEEQEESAEELPADSSVHESAEDDDDKGEKEEESEEEEAEEVLTESGPGLLRGRDHIEQILGISDDRTADNNERERIASDVLKEIKKMYDAAVRPLEQLYKFKDISNRQLGDAEIFSKPTVMFMGPWSTGKSSLINYLLGTEYSRFGLKTGAEPTSNSFTVVMYGDQNQVLDGTQLAADWAFSTLQKFGQGFLDKLKGRKLPHPLLKKLTIVDTPGILENRKATERQYPFNDAFQWFIDRADLIYIVFDPTKLDVGLELEALFDQLKGREHQVRILLNKADTVKPQELMKVQGTLLWNLSPLVGTSEAPTVYVGSFWSKPFLPGSPTTLLTAQEEAFLEDITEAIEGRVENKVAQARRHAVRVRNHAKMVDCYLTTYYNHKSIFSNKRKVADDIVDNPQHYHIYEGLSTMTNVSRYDLPDPEIYREFFHINALFDFKPLASTCSYFKGCPLDKLDIAIAYDLPELAERYHRLIGTQPDVGGR